MPLATHSEAGRGDSKLAKYPWQDQYSKFRCQPLYFILDNPERGFKVLHTEFSNKIVYLTFQNHCLEEVLMILFD